ncbi:MAG: GNAT family N-acetyltransferase [Actinomycetota bacterium]|nr:GNAT family N-acetyltransferase [Actinomycetota bacterium]
MILETARLRLRPVTGSDVSALVGLDSDPLVMRYVSDGVPTSREVIEGWVLPRADAERRAHNTGMWTAVDRDAGHFRGWFALRTPRHSHRPEVELSYRLTREVWGRGLATEGAHALLTMSFRELGAERVFASTMAANIASRRVMEKIGMRLSAIHLCDEDILFGSGSGEVEYELLHSHWETTTMTWFQGRRSVGPTHPQVSGRARHTVGDLTA